MKPVAKPPWSPCIHSASAYCNPLLTAFRNLPIDEGAAEAAVDFDPSPLLAAASEDPGRRAAAAGGQGADGVHRQRQPRHRRAKAGGVQLGGLLLGFGPRGGGGTPGSYFFKLFS